MALKLSLNTTFPSQANTEDIQAEMRNYNDIQSTIFIPFIKVELQWTFPRVIRRLAIEFKRQQKEKKYKLNIKKNKNYKKNKMQCF